MNCENVYFRLPKEFDEIDDAATRRRKKKNYYAKLRKQEEEREKELAEKYRDRVCMIKQFSKNQNVLKTLCK